MLFDFSLLWNPFVVLIVITMWFKNMIISVVTFADGNFLQLVNLQSLV